MHNSLVAEGPLGKAGEMDVSRFSELPLYSLSPEEGAGTQGTIALPAFLTHPHPLS